MASTSIQWTDHSINPLRARHKATGKIGHYCEKIASGCKFCYSSKMQRRFGTPEFGGGQLRDEYELFLDESKLEEVRRRKKPTKYFWCDMTDMFGGWVKPEWLTACFATIDATPQHTHQLLTKRPENVRRMWPAMHDRRPIFPGCPGPLGEPQPCIVPQAHRPNVWLGCSVSDQATADDAIPHLLACRDLAPVLFVSYEPALGPVDLGEWLPSVDGTKTFGADGELMSFLDWCIAGGESGHNARPFNIEWARSARDQCRAAGVPFFLKQLGARPVADYYDCPVPAVLPLKLKDSHGGLESEWPGDLQGRREFPSVEAHHAPA